MRSVKAQEFGNDYQYQQAKKAARRSEIGRRSGRRGSQVWGLWIDRE